MKKFIIMFLECVMVLGFSMGSSGAEVIWQEISRGNLNARAVLPDPDNPQVIYIGTNNSVLKTEDHGENWRNILLIRGQNRSVNFLSFDPKDKNSLYAACGSGLYYSNNQGRDWKRIFKGKNYLENECTSIALFPDTIYLGTNQGLFVSKDRGSSWQKQTGRLGNSHILAIVYNLKEPNYIYIACVDGVFTTEDAGQSWERVFASHTSAEKNNDEEEPEDQDESGRFFNIRHISIDPNDLNCLYLATSKGVYRSQDKGKGWELLSSEGLLNRDVLFLLVSNNSNLYAITKPGIFWHRQDRWDELSLGLVAEEVRSLNLDNQDNLYAACDKGLFKANAPHFDNNKKFDIISLYCKGEPQINEIQNAAIKYAQVIDPGRIESSRRQARLKAILPELNLDYDKTVTSYSNTTATRFTVGPLEWGVSLKWNLSDLIWSEQQRLIDSQTRLMVGLRDEILDEVTKLYFERLRVKMELDNLSIEDRKKRLEKELRLQELTASLDALTGGYFSGQLKIK